MANQSIYNAFERMWTHVVNALNGKADESHTHDDRYTTTTELDAALAEKSDVSHNHTVASVTDLTVTAAEINYLEGTTSPIQEQIDSLNETFNTYFDDLLGGAS